MRLYGRKAQRGQEPNDRRYDRHVEGLVKNMDPVELDALFRDEGEDGEDPVSESKSDR